MKKLANLKKDLPKKSKLNLFQRRNLKGGNSGEDKRKDRITSTPIPTLSSIIDTIG